MSFFIITANLLIPLPSKQKGRQYFLPEYDTVYLQLLYQVVGIFIFIALMRLFFIEKQATQK